MSKKAWVNNTTGLGLGLGLGCKGVYDTGGDSLESLRTEIKELKEQLEEALVLRREERKGRTHAEQKNRQLLLDTVKQRGNVWSIEEIGKMRTPFPDRRGTPRQGTLAPHIRAKLVIKAGYNDALIGLGDFSHVYVLFVFHENTNAIKQLAGKKSVLKVVPPRKGTKVGVFSTRSPHRPNPIGMSVCKVLSVDVEKGVVYLSGVDLVDKTPVIDIKPYIPYDVISPNELLTPAWVAPNIDVENKQVKWTSNCYEKLELAAMESEMYYENIESLKLCIEECLRQDPRSKMARGKIHSNDNDSNLNQNWYIRVDNVKCHFSVYDNHIQIHDIVEQ